MDPNTKRLTPEDKAPAALDTRAFRFATRTLPWFAGLLMLGVYGLTLNHWISLASLPLASGLEGLNRGAGLTGPVTFALTYPFSSLPPEWVPLALNSFSALCAALSLALLARSVALLPHDLDPRPQGRRRSAPPQLLTLPTAWVPPAVAVLVCGLQLTFWQNAVTGTGEMLNLLMFAFVVRCFVEYHCSREDAWLLRGTAVYGLALANDWAMAAFFPAFLVALIWIKRIFVFNEHFLKRLLRRPRSFRWRLLWQIPACGIAGLLFFLLLPAVADFSSAAHMDFWPALRHSLHLYQASLTHFPRTLLLTSALISLTPLLVISLRFYQFAAGGNRINQILGMIFSHLAYGFFLLVSLWTMLDSPISPRRLGIGAASLPVYFLEAVSIGYFTGHFLLAVALIPEPSKRRMLSSRMEQRRQKQRRLIQSVKRVAVAAICLLGLATITTLAGKNLPVIAAKSADPAGQYIQQLADALPPEGAVLIGNDEIRLVYLQAALIRSGRQNSYLLLNTEALVDSPEYFGFVKQLNPGFNLNFNLPVAADATNRAALPAGLLQWLHRDHDIYSLTPVPTDDLIAEYFYFEPHGLLYELKRYPVDSAFARPTPPAVIAENQAFWRNFETNELPGLQARVQPAKPPSNQKLWKRFLNTLRFWPEADRGAVLIGTYYAGALNDWGVALQKAGDFPAAGRCFAEALALDPLNPAAQINQKFNADYLANRQETIQRPLETAKSLTEYRDWRHVVRAGAVDEPNYCYMLGAFMADNNLFRPAIAQFERVTQLSPARLDTYESLARLFIECGDLTNALRASDAVLAVAPEDEMGLLLKANASIELGAFTAAIPLLNQLLALNPTNSLALLNRGIAYRGSGRVDAAKRDYNAVIQMAPRTFPAYFDLGLIAEQEKEPAAAITNYELFLRYAPPSLPQIATAEARLKALKPDKQ